MTVRDEKGRFVPGHSGNPAGKPRKPNSVARAIRERLAEHVDEIVAALLEQVRAGDVTAIRTALERLAPALRPEALPAEMPDVEQQLRAGVSVRDVARHVLVAVATGDIDTKRAAEVLTALGHAANLAELEELRERLFRLENPELGDLV